ncbi:MAG: fluoride efflux transporter CrcB [Alistipes sp.]
MIRELLAVGLGGAFGSIARYLLSSYLLVGHTLYGLPAATFAINVIGSLLIGFLLGILQSTTLIWFLIMGFCGGFTTFSTFSAEVVNLLSTGRLMPAALYITASVVVCVMCTAGGVWLGQVVKI